MAIVDKSFPLGNGMVHIPVTFFSFGSPDFV